MNMSPTSFKRLVAATLIIAASAAWSQDQNALLERLRTAPHPEAMQIERELALIWSRSGSDSMDLLLERGRRALRDGEYEAAVGHLTALTDHAPDFAEGWNARAIAYWQLGQFGPSIADIQKTLALNPNHFGAMAGLASMLEDMGEFEEALEVQERISAIHPTRPGVSESIQRLRKKVGSAEL
jgi:tetratricopeptide (TPR) repeat protein